MHISLSWLGEFLDHGLTVSELEALLTSTGLSVEGIGQSGVDLPKVVVAAILESNPHPNADRLSVCQVDDGSGSPRQIVCGAKNYRVGGKVPLALPGAVLPGDFKIKSGKLRGETSEGMMCSGKELGLSQDAAGLWILPEESVPGTSLAELYPPQTILELEITPNRPDWLSHLGVAREIAAFLGRTITFAPTAAIETVENTDIARIEEGGQCSFYSVRRISGVRVGPSPDWLRQRLESIGLRAINNVVDVTNYVLHELGQPLHAFDAAKVQGAIVVRPGVAGEKFSALDGTVHSLSSGDTVIADSGSVLALGGVVGGLESGVTESSTDILLESARFVPTAIRKTSRRTGLQTDSSYRFERGVDPEMVLQASNRATELICELAGGTAEEFVVTAGSPTLEKSQVLLRHERCRALLGIDLTDEEIVDFLQRLGLVQPGDAQPGLSTWAIPSYRLDLEREVDLIEEVARMAGIDRIPSRLVATVAARLPSDDAYDFADSLRGKLTSLGFFEARLSTLVSPNSLAGREASALRLKNPLGEEQSFLRPSLLPGLQDAARRNFHAGLRDVRLFEIGSIYRQAVPEQVSSLALLACGSLLPRGWQETTSATFSFFDLLGLLDQIFPCGLVRRPVELPGCAVGAELLLGEIVIGTAGILSPSLAREMDAPGEVVVAELQLPALQAAWSSPPKPHPGIPKFPSTTRDLALVLDESVSYGKIAAALTNAKESLLRSFEPFDIFRDAEGTRLPIGKKSVAVSLTFQSGEKTLESSEIDAAVSRLKQVLQRDLTADFRE